MRQFTVETVQTVELNVGWDWIGWLSYTAVTPRASLQSDANNLATQASSPVPPQHLLLVFLPFPAQKIRQNLSEQ